MRRTLPFAFVTRVAHQLAQMLPIAVRVGLKQFAQGFVAFVDQAFAPGLEVMHGGGLASRQIAIMRQCGTQRFKLLRIERAQLFGQKLDLALARDLLSHSARAQHFVA